MRYYIIINPPQYRDNAEDEGGYAWAGEAASEDDAFEKACDACEEDNGWGKYDDDPAMAEHTAIDREHTSIIECGPDYKAASEAADALVFDLWQFIDNTAEDAPDRQDKFFALRERVRDRQRA